MDAVPVVEGRRRGGSGESRGLNKPGRRGRRSVVTVDWGVLHARRLMCSLVLLHIVLARKRLVASRAVDVLLPRMFLPMTRSVTRSSEGVPTSVSGGVGAGIFLLCWLTPSRGVCTRRNGRDGRGH